MKFEIARTGACESVKRDAFQCGPPREARKASAHFAPAVRCENVRLDQASHANGVGFPA